MIRLKFQVWGAGGGSGYFKERHSGSGGGGAFVGKYQMEPSLGPIRASLILAFF
jgi:hypothetical protein